MRRITVEEVVSAYAKVRLHPKRRNWGDGVTCGCPTMAMVRATNHRLGKRYGAALTSGKMFDHACNVLGVDEHYLAGFIAGVDHPDQATTDGVVRRYTDGVVDGTAVAKALWPEIE